MSLNKRYGITIMIVLRPCIYLLDLGPVSQMTDVAHRSYILSHLKMYCIRNSPSMLRKCYDQYVYTCVSVKAKMLYGFYGFILFSLFFFSKKDTLPDKTTQRSEQSKFIFDMAFSVFIFCNTLSVG